MGFRILCMCESMGVISLARRDPHLTAHAQKLRIDRLLVLITMIPQFQEIITSPKMSWQRFAACARACVISADDLPRHFSRQAGRAGDDPS